MSGDEVCTENLTWLHGYLSLTRIGIDQKIYLILLIVCTDTYSSS